MTVTVILLLGHVLGTARIWDPAMWLQGPSSEPLRQICVHTKAKSGHGPLLIIPESPWFMHCSQGSKTNTRRTKWLQEWEKKEKRGRQKSKGNLNNQGCPRASKSPPSRNYLFSHIGNPLIHLMIMSWVPDAPNKTPGNIIQSLPPDQMEFTAKVYFCF